MAGYLALWPALYLLAAACLLADVEGIPRPSVTASVLLVAVAVSVYLIDRVKLADRLVDPGDAETHPRRHAWLWAHRGLARALAGLALVTASVAGYLLHPALALAPLVGQAAVFAYSGVPPRPDRRLARLKDIPLVKNVAAALALATVAALSLRHMADPPHLIAIAGAVGVVALLIAADCMMCDVGDARGDRRHGTLTVPVLLGERAGRLIASVLAVGAAVWAWVVVGPTEWYWPVAIVGSQIALAVVPSRFVRNATDLRLPLLAVVIALTS